MPASSRLALVAGIGSPLRARVPLVDDLLTADGWPQIWENGMFGGYLTAVADDTRARIRVDLYWPGVRTATIKRVHADGTTYAVRGGDPATMCTGWARYDYEAPLDQAVTYQATSTDAAGASVTTPAVTVSSGGRHWLKNITYPARNLRITVGDRGKRTQDARRGILRPPLRRDPIIVHQPRALDAGSIALYAADAATETALRELLADGGPLLLQYPSVAGGESLYLSVDQVAYDPVVRLTVDLQRVITLPFDAMGRPDGEAAGDPDASYDLLGDAYQTYNQVEAGYATYLDLSMSLGS